MIRKALILIISAIALSGCINDGMDDTLLSQSEISLNWKGDRQVTYSPEKYQMGFHDRKNEFRVYDDRLANWFTVRCSQMPVEEGQELTADVSWTGSRSTKSYSALPFTVEKTDGQGMIWLWCSKERIGIIIKNIR